MSTSDQEEPSSLPSMIQRTGSRSGASPPVVRLYASMAVGLPKSKMRGWRLKSSHLEKSFPSIKFAVPSPAGESPPGLATAPGTTEIPPFENRNSESWILFAAAPLRSLRKVKLQILMRKRKNHTSKGAKFHRRMKSQREVNKNLTKQASLLFLMNFMPCQGRAIRQQKKY